MNSTVHPDRQRAATRERVARWRERNPELNLMRQRYYARIRRARLELQRINAEFR